MRFFFVQPVLIKQALKKATVHYLLSSQQHIRSQPVNTAELLAAKEPDMSLGGRQRPRRALNTYIHEVDSNMTPAGGNVGLFLIVEVRNVLLTQLEIDP